MYVCLVEPQCGQIFLAWLGPSYATALHESPRRLAVELVKVASLTRFQRLVKAGNFELNDRVMRGSSRAEVPCSQLVAPPGAPQSVSRSVWFELPAPFRPL